MMMERPLRDTVTALLLGALGVALLLWLLHLMNLDVVVIALLCVIDGAGPVGVLAFALLSAALVPLLAPTVLLTLGAGALFGVIGGTLLQRKDCAPASGTAP